MRTVCFVSDRTGVTAETLGFSLLAQFSELTVRTVTMPFVASVRDAEGVVQRINAIGRQEGQRPIVLSTLVNDEVRAVLQKAEAFVHDFFDAFLAPLEAELQMRSAHVSGIESFRSGKDPASSERVAATDYALANDDGAGPRDYRSAAVILIGVSRCGKTPTCLYLAVQYAVFAANYPLTEEDLASGELPKVLRPHRERLFGLTIHPERLKQIREERRPGSNYAAPGQIDKEIRAALEIFDNHRIPYLDVTHRSVEENASRILDSMRIERHVRL
jgi:regulator of PEP synthase PpsR (kinase-PPPase family)